MKCHTHTFASAHPLRWSCAWLQGKTAAEVENFSRLFGEIQQQIDTKQLRPMVRTQYLRTAFQIPFDSTVRVSLDTNLTMIKENPTDGPTCTVAGRCACSPDNPDPSCWSQS